MFYSQYFKRFFLFVAYSLTGAFCLVRAQPVAAFTSNVTQGCTPVEVQFSDQSTANPTNWFWDFGDGTTSTLKNPIKAFTVAGSFTIRLTVSNALGSNSLSKPGLITVKPIPTSQFSASPTVGCFPLNVNFTDLSTGSGVGTINQWSWSFGDGTFSSLQNPSHTYTTFGDFDVSLYVANTDGCAAYLNKPALVTIGDTVKADFDTTMQPYCRLPKIVSFINASAASGTLTYAWDFGDGTGSNQANPVHSYNAFGTYPVKLIVTSSYGCSNAIIKPNYIKADTVITDFAMPASACINVPVFFNNLSVPSTVSGHWSFGDGTDTSLFSPSKTYRVPGNYTVVLTNRFANGCIDSAIKTLPVLDRPAVAFTSSQPKTACKAPLTVSFTDGTPAGVLRQWDFGDGSTATGASVSHTYLTQGIFSVKLVVTNASGCKDSLTKTGHVIIAPPKVNIKLDPAGGCVPYTASPVANITSVDAVTAYDWNFGDGFTSTAPGPAHTYTSTGVFSLRLIITTAGGCIDTAYKTIRVGVPPVIGFNIYPKPVCAKKAIYFNDTSTAGNAILWDFGDGHSASSKNAVHTYAVPGTYSVLMIADNGGCIKDTFLSNYVTVLPPAGDFTFDQDCNNKFRFDFSTQASIGATSCQWNFGDGNTATGSNPSHVYAIAGNYTVSLFATNGSCTDTVKKSLIAGVSTTSFKVNNTVTCRNNPLVFTAHYVTPAYVFAYKWNWGDGLSNDVNDSITQHTYTVSGTYTVRLIVVNIFGCVDTVIQKNLVIVNGAKAAFSVANPAGCSGRTVNFNDLSIPDGTHLITNWKWDFGDGITQSYATPPFSHSYSTDGKFNVKLTVTDASGCVDSTMLDSAVVTSRPVISFSSPDTISCPLAPVRLIATGQGINISYRWNTGIGFLNGDTVIARYTDSGRYSIRLYATDANGCVDSAVKAGYISIRKPAASFTMSDSISICPPLKIRFTNTSSYYNRLIWDFDNGYTSFQQTPYVSFPLGTFNVKLKITSPGGCADSAIRQVKVFPYTNQFTYQPVSGCQPLAVTFKLSTPSVGTYKWYFNDGTTINTTDSFVTKKYTSFGPYQPRVFFTETASGCIIQAGGGIVINVFGTKANYGMNDSVFCGSGTVQFSDSSVATGPMTYRWIFGDGNFSTQQNPAHTYTTPGRYTVQQIVSSGTCSDTMTKTSSIVVYPKPNVFIVGDSVGCQPFSTRFTARLLQTDTSTIAWNWDFGNGQTSTLQNPPQQLYTLAGNFTVSLRTTASSGCISDTSKLVVVNPLPNINAGNDTTVCASTPVTLRATGAANYRWLPPTSSQLSCTNCASPVATLASPSEWYYVQGTTLAGCQATDSVHVKYLPSYTVTAEPASDSICIGESVQLSASGAQLYLWTPAAGLSAVNIANPIATPTITTSYRLVATDTLGCQTFIRNIPVTVFPYPTINAGPDITIAGGASVVLNAIASADAILYKWTPSSQLSCTDCLTPTAKPRATTTYRILVSNSGTCSASDTITVTVLCNNTNVFIPNTFSPNGDGSNDVFYPRGTGLYSIKSFRIFSRWGDMVFGKSNMAPNDPSQGWDGNYKGNRAVTDVYTFIAEVYCENNTLITLTGTVNLIY